MCVHAHACVCVCVCVLGKGGHCRSGRVIVKGQEYYYDVIIIC